MLWLSVAVIRSILSLFAKYMKKVVVPKWAEWFN